MPGDGETAGMGLQIGAVLLATAGVAPTDLGLKRSRIRVGNRHPGFHWKGVEEFHAYVSALSGVNLTLRGRVGISNLGLETRLGSRTCSGGEFTG